MIVKPKKELSWQSDIDLADRVKRRNTPIRTPTIYEKEYKEKRRKETREALIHLKTVNSIQTEKPTEQKSLTEVFKGEKDA